MGRELVWDGHGCLPLVPEPTSAAGLDLYRRAGVDVVSVNIGDSDVPLERQVRLASCFRDHVRRHPDELVMVETVPDVDAARASGRLGVVFDVEGAHALGGQLDLVDVYRRLGVRTMALVYNLANGAGGGCHDHTDEGLTPFGRRLVRELDDAGIVVDCSHAGHRTARDAIDASANPVVFSHSNPRVLCDHPRNVSDELIVACARSGGVVGINGISIFLGDGTASPQRVADHIDHVVQLVGPEHVALGLDFVVSGDDLASNIAASPAFWPSGYGYEGGLRCVEPARISEVTASLRVRGYDDAAVGMVLGENLRRIAATVWR